jgi:rRNA maturation RNase YbeY
MIQVNILYDDNIDKKHFSNVNLLKLKKFIGFMTMDQLEVNLNYILVTTNKIIEINKEFLNHNYSTDIITFDLSEHDDIINGEIYICLDELAENAKKYKVHLNEEFNRLLVHGFLHLIGYKDSNEKEKKIMKFGEDLFLSLIK